LNADAFARQFVFEGMTEGDNVGFAGTVDAVEYFGRNTDN